MRRWTIPAQFLECAAMVLVGVLGAGHDAAASEPATPSTAFDAQHAYRLNWSAPTGCPTQADVAERIQLLLADSQVTTPALLDVTANLSVAKTASYHADIAYETQGARSDRQLHAATCDALASATALIIATAIDPAAASRASLLESNPEPVDAPTPSPPTSPPPTPAVLAKRTEKAPPPKVSKVPPRWWVAALPWGGINVLPGLAWGGGGSLGFRPGAVTLGVDGRYWAKQFQAIDGRPNTGGDFDRFDVGVRACYGAMRGAWLVDACGGVELLILRGDGRGVSDPGHGSEAWLAPWLGPSVSVRVTRHVFLLARLEASFPAKRHDFVLDGVGPVYSLPAVGERLGLGVAAAF